MNAFSERSPFPGMDPYLEQKWPEVHASLIVYARNQLNSQLPRDLQANIEENLAIRYDDDSSPCPERHIAIVNAAGKVVTAIEFLSPWNKLGEKGRASYVRKQLDYIAAGINLVEVDLVRQGRYILAAYENLIPADSRTPYLICVYRDEAPLQAELYRAPLSEPLPNIPVPLRPREPDAVLQLQTLIDNCYRDGRYYRTNYEVDPEPPLVGDDARWADTLLREQGWRK